MSKFASILGFRSKNAQNIVRVGVDHHRTRQILHSCLIALAKELLRPFIIHCRENRQTPDAYQYTRWIEENVQCESYMFYYHVTFTYLLAFIPYTDATRKNHGQLMLGKCQIIVTVVLRKVIISAGIDFDRFLQLFVPLKNEVRCFQHTKYSSDTEYY